MRAVTRASVLMIGALLLASSGVAEAQPPVKGTVALDRTVQQEYTGAHLVIVKAMAGFGQLGRFTKGRFGHPSLTIGSDGSSHAPKRQPVAAAG